MRALVGFGGGRNGSFPMGVLNGDLLGKSWDAYYGTSTSAICLAAIAHVGLKQTTDIWNGIKGTSDIYGSRGIGIPGLDNVIDAIGTGVDLATGGGGGRYNHKPLEALIVKNIVGKPTVPVTVNRVSLATRRQQMVTANPSGVYVNSNLEDPVTDLPGFQQAVLSSAMTPGLVDLVAGKWADGGVREMGLVEKAIADGHTDITILLCDMYSDGSTAPTPVGNGIDTVLRALSCLTNQEMLDDIAVGLGNPNIHVTIYAPLVDLGDPADFDPKAIASNMALGMTAKPIIVK